MAAAHVLVHDAEWDLGVGGVGRDGIEPAAQDRKDALAIRGADRDRALASGVEARAVVRLGASDQPHARPVRTLRLAPAEQDLLDERRRSGADRCGPPDDPRRWPCAGLAVRSGPGL